MPLLMTHAEDSFQWAVWKMEESPDELLAMLPRRTFYEEEAETFRSGQRRLEWLSTRVLLFAMLGEEKRISYNPDGKPYLPGERLSISISHTLGYAAVLIGRQGQRVGVDIEHFADRIRRISAKYMRPDELPAPYQGTDLWSLLLHWSAKEVMFKCMSTPEVDFREHLRIFPFEVAEQGFFLAEEYRTPLRLRFHIRYLLHPDFVFTWQA